MFNGLLNNSDQHILHRHTTKAIMVSYFFPLTVHLYVQHLWPAFMETQSGVCIKVTSQMTKRPLVVTHVKVLCCELHQFAAGLVQPLIDDGICSFTVQRESSFRGTHWKRERLLHFFCSSPALFGALSKYTIIGFRAKQKFGYRNPAHSRHFWLRTSENVLT